MRILMIGDVIGRPGRRAVAQALPQLRREHHIDLVVVNGENAAGGRGLTPETAHELLDAGVDVITSGNHIWDEPSIIPHLDGALPVVRPLNYPPGVPGRGSLRTGPLLVLNLVGRTFMGNYDCPFRAADAFLAGLKDKPPFILVDFHAEATSEKQALGRYLDGRATAVVGTHTHVGTVDTRLLPRGTAFVTDVGMTGPRDSVIGDDPEAVIQRFLHQTPHRLAVGKGEVTFNSVLIEADEATRRATSIVRLDLEVDPR
ncbi:MAG: TIGR00282 family metallophosphoesterase [Chloroflexi bacterium]|nr:TIGR00282 family metallophosphoesterase [Chloroflexota bacterium]